MQQHLIACALAEFEFEVQFFNVEDSALFIDVFGGACELLHLGAVEWIVFACFVPAAVITYLVLNSVFFGGRGNLYVVLGLVASIFAVGYLVLLRFGMNFWQLFLILIPAEAVVYFSFHIRAKH